MKRVSIVLGTRPEAIKLCPVIVALRNHPDFEPHVCVTGQHRHMLDQVLETFGVVPDVDLSLMERNQTLGEFSSRAIASCDRYMADSRPDLVLVQGDTTTVLCAALSAFYHGIPVGHVEAGLRTFNKLSPFPEEINRTLTTKLADLHFAPTTQARENLLREDVPSERIFVTGNTVIDALLFAVGRVHACPPDIPGLANGIASRVGELVLITGHRRENFGEGIQNVCRAIAELAVRFPDTDFVYPVHLNPNVREPVLRLLGRSEGAGSNEVADSALSRRNIHLIDPLPYLPFVALMERATLIVTDSGGVQEEAPSLGKPVLVTRDTTERGEALASGGVRLVGTDSGAIVRAVSELLENPRYRAAMGRAVNPYGDGRACERILAAIESAFPAAGSLR